MASCLAFVAGFDFSSRRRIFVPQARMERTVDKAIHGSSRVNVVSNLKTRDRRPPSKVELTLSGEVDLGSLPSRDLDPSSNICISQCPSTQLLTGIFCRAEVKSKHSKVLPQPPLATESLLGDLPDFFKIGILRGESLRSQSWERGTISRVLVSISGHWMLQHATLVTGDGSIFRDGGNQDLTIRSVCAQSWRGAFIFSLF
ncbi:uncharacterized protein ARMOST_20129 [Armillaria ostoyae]|uniref:Uncharacterized protein n=1 Tax=Armillaria ostoyae TaxID=47428 RepID=A0A284S6G4_ARMOS|nr:uncharacterized protein ARMOST_20129 [Armillaria ostoyae]